MSYLAENWPYILFLALFAGMHLLDFGCGYGHQQSANHKRRRGGMDRITHESSTERPPLY